MYSIRLCLAFLVLLIPCRPILAQESDEAASLIRALCTNLDALRQYDVIIEREEVHDVPFRSVARVVTYTRIRYDRDAERAICAAHSRKVEESFRENDSTKPIWKVRLCGLQWSGGKGLICEVPQVPQDVSTLAQAFRDQNVPDLRCVGLDPFPTRFVGKGEIDCFNNWRNTQLVNPTLAVGKSDGRTQVVEFRPRWNAGDGDEFVQSWIFDLDKLVPIRFERKVLIAKNGKKDPKPVEHQTIDWKDENGCMVPTRIQGDKTAQEGDVIYQIESTVFFHWLSVNKPFTDELFSRSLIADDSHLIRLSDPSLNGIKPGITK
ncbi:MAG: hypothetical protein U0892_23285 [Pirellulales bacterium]